MNMFKKNGGFTLVELIVVIAILAILAGVAVPAYSGYITKANEAADYTMLDAVKTAVVFATVDIDNDAVVKTITITKPGDNPTVAVTGENMDDIADLDISAYVSSVTFKSGATKAEWDASTGEWTLTKG